MDKQTEILSLRQSQVINDPAINNINKFISSSNSFLNLFFVS